VTRRSGALILLTLVGLLGTSCSRDSSEGADDGPLRLTFDGESCTHEGSTELKAGLVTIDFVNEMEETENLEWLQVNVMRHTGDETVQDMIDHYGPGPSTEHQPSWATNPQPDPWGFPVHPGETVSWEGDLESGTYTMVCGTWPIFNIWFGTGFMVED
jgi:hypothetical protein